jgi:transposase-like protein
MALLVCVGVAEDLKAIFKVRRDKMARSLAEEFVALYGKRFPKAVTVFEAGIGEVLTYLSFPGSHHARLRTTNTSVPDLNDRLS